MRLNFSIPSRKAEQLATIAEELNLSYSAAACSLLCSRIEAHVSASSVLRFRLRDETRLALASEAIRRGMPFNDLVLERLISDRVADPHDGFKPDGPRSAIRLEGYQKRFLEQSATANAWPVQYEASWRVERAIE